MTQNTLFVLAFVPFLLMWFGRTWLIYLVMLLASAAIFAIEANGFLTYRCQGTDCVGAWANVLFIGIGLVLFAFSAIGKALRLLTIHYRERRQAATQAPR